ncbi:MAG: hypothetical protein BM558_02925 [Roseobacter sp. MedPE-SW]|nr:MAG: hypothetical protein BM558_02925 [Roseobacter sp. MedPE-SW]
MGYTIHLEGKHGQEITFQEWQVVVDNHPLVRLSQETTHTVTNPATGEQVGTTITPGDAEIWIEGLNSWVFAFRWSSGHVSINAPRDFDDENSFLRKLLRELATELGASIRGGEGEEYK